MRQLPPCSLPAHIYFLAKTVVRTPSVVTQCQESQLSEGEDKWFKAGLDYKVSARSVSETLSKKTPNGKQLKNFRNWKISYPPNSRTFLPQARSSYRLSTSFSLPLTKLLATTVSTNLTTPRPYTKGLTKCLCLKLTDFRLPSLLEASLSWSVLECPPFSSAVRMVYHVVSTCSSHAGHCTATFWLRWELLSGTKIKRGCFPWDRGSTEVTKRNLMKSSVESAPHLQ